MENNELPEVSMDVAQVIEYYGYTYENHDVTTSDGYILALHRIPFGKGGVAGKSRPVVFLLHGLLNSSFTWISNKPTGSLGFVLADNGYDVWMGNSRGNIYSRKHKTLSNQTNKFWNFTWDEMVKYDLPNCVDYILAITKSAKLSLIGHSQGTEITFAKLSENSSFNKKISSFIALAPVAYIGHIKFSMAPLFRLAGALNLALQFLEHGEFLPNSSYLTHLTESLCKTEKLSIECNNFIFLIYGIDRTNLDDTRLSIYNAHIPAGTSSKSIVHYAQSVKSNKFQKYDYGYVGNLIHYHSLKPPQYGLKIKGVPVALFSGGKDLSATPEDVGVIVKDLGDSLKMNKLVPHYSHLDFMWAKDLNECVYKDVITFLASQNK